MQRFIVHPQNPQERLLKKAAEAIEQGAVLAFPTDSAYALGCKLGNVEGVERIRQIRQVDKAHNFTIICRNLSEIATYAIVSNSQFRLLKAYTPGPFTFILDATKEVPRKLQHAKRKTIGMRVPDCPVTQDLLCVLNEPLMSVTLLLPGDDVPLSDPDIIEQKLAKRIDVLIDAGTSHIEPTTVIDWTDELPHISRQGRGLISGIE